VRVRSITPEFRAQGKKASRLLGVQEERRASRRSPTSLRPRWTTGDRFPDLEETEGRPLSRAPRRCRMTAVHGPGKTGARVQFPSSAPGRPRPTRGPSPCKRAMPVQARRAAPQVWPAWSIEKDDPLIRGKAPGGTGSWHPGGSSGRESAATSKADGLWKTRGWGSRPQPSARRRRRPRACRRALKAPDPGLRGVRSIRTVSATSFRGEATSNLRPRRPTGRIPDF
jgi:hypothetical protein